ncbi:MAG: hypothetical protein R3C14_49050 [Caldilineaceae bacterium]
MAYWLRAFLILIVALTVALSVDASSALPPTFYAVTPNALLATVTLQAEPVHAGETQQLTVTLNKTPGSQTIFSLEITYADGSTQAVVDATLSNIATLTWEIPRGTQPGLTTFHLATTGCGCGERTIAQPTTNLESSIDGWFVVE